MTRAWTPLLLSIGCAGDPGVAKHQDAAGDSASADPVDDSTADSGTPEDEPERGDSGDPTAAEPCALGLQVSVDASELAPGEELHVGEAPSRAWDAVATVRLHNPCDENLRFLGHPDDWLSGAGFSLQSLPPVYLGPGESADIALSFTPGDAGAASGELALPYDQEGSPFTAPLTATATAPLTLVAVGEGRRVSTTHDYGTTWTTDAWDTLEGHTNAMQRGMCWGSRTFVAVGGSDASHWWTSADGDEWTAHVEAGGAIGDCDFGDGRFVAFAGDLLTSTDGQSWSVSPQPYSPDHLRAMAHGLDAAGTHRWVAVGDSGRVAVTLDGTSWSFDATPLSDSVRHVAHGVGTAGPVWVAVGSSGTVATSPDGESWTEQVVGSGADWSGVVFGGDRFLVGSGSALYTSFDGYSWSLVGASAVVPLAHLGQMWVGADAAAALFLSTDHGLTWSELRAPDGGPGYAAAAFAMEAP